MPDVLPIAIPSVRRDGAGVTAIAFRLICYLEGVVFRA
jgi:hypothetical protein